jgi:hypothetical protein
MKTATALSALTMAVAAIAAPSDIEARGSSGSCNTRTHKQVCCNGFLACTVQVLGSNCNNDAYCCKTNAPVVSILRRVKTKRILTSVGRSHQRRSPQLSRYSLNVTPQRLSLWRISWITRALSMSLYLTLSRSTFKCGVMNSRSGAYGPRRAHKRLRNWEIDSEDT